MHTDEYRAWVERVNATHEEQTTRPADNPAPAAGTESVVERAARIMSGGDPCEGALSDARALADAGLLADPDEDDPAVCGVESPYGRCDRPKHEGDHHATFIGGNGDPFDDADMWFVWGGGLTPDYHSARLFDRAELVSHDQWRKDAEQARARVAELEAEVERLQIENARYVRREQSEERFARLTPCTCSAQRQRADAAEAEVERLREDLTYADHQADAHRRLRIEWQDRCGTAEERARRAQERVDEYAVAAAGTLAEHERLTQALRDIRDRVGTSTVAWHIADRALFAADQTSDATPSAGGE